VHLGGPHLIKPVSFSVGSTDAASPAAAPRLVGVHRHSSRWRGSWDCRSRRSVDLGMLVMNDKGLQHLLSSKFQLSGEGSAAAGPVGPTRPLATDWR